MLALLSRTLTGHLFRGWVPSMTATRTDGTRPPNSSAAAPSVTVVPGQCRDALDDEVTDHDQIGGQGGVDDQRAGHPEAEIVRAQPEPDGGEPGHPGRRPAVPSLVGQGPLDRFDRGAAEHGQADAGPVGERDVVDPAGRAVLAVGRPTDPADPAKPG